MSLPPPAAVEAFRDHVRDEAALLAYLDSAHLPYQLTSDVALIEGAGPSLAYGRGRFWLAGTFGFGFTDDASLHRGRILFGLTH